MLRPITQAYYGVRSRIHLRHFRGRSIHSPFLYSLVRHVFMAGQVIGPERDLYDALRLIGVGHKQSVLLQNLYTHTGLNAYTLLGPGLPSGGIGPTHPGGHNLCILLPGVSLRVLMQASERASEQQDTLVVLAPHLTRRSREAVRSIRHRRPCLSIDRCNLQICVFDRKLQPQHYRI